MCEICEFKKMLGEMSLQENECKGRMSAGIRESTIKNPQEQKPVRQ